MCTWLPPWDDGLAREICAVSQAQHTYGQGPIVEHARYKCIYIYIYICIYTCIYMYVSSALE